MSDAVALALTRDLLESVAEEMAETCVRTAASANIKERRDLSAAVFDGEGTMVAHAAHIPVHLGAMPMGVRAALRATPLRPGDVVLANDPYEGGTHLPDVSAIAPLFDERGRRRFLVAVRAHHADVGGATPGSMAPADSIHAEGVRIPPITWVREGRRSEGITRLLLANLRDPKERLADLAAQSAALARGIERLGAIGAREPRGLAGLSRRAADLVAYARRLGSASLRALSDGEATARAPLGVPDLAGRPAVVCARIAKRGGALSVDFAGTSGPVGLGLNATAAVAHSAVYYLVRCLCPPDTPANDGLLAAVTVRVPAGSLLDARYPSPVAGGNVETSQRVVDALWLAAGRLWPDRFGAPGAGTMSNWTLGPAPGGPWFPSYYETVPGGAGGGPSGPGADAVQQHMTNTRSTPVEALEGRHPLRFLRHAVRTGSGGAGRHRGGDGVVREFEVRAPAVFAWMATRFHSGEDPPPGAHGGRTGRCGRLTVVRGGRAERMAAQGRLTLRPGDVVRIETPGGGGWGRPR